MNQKWMELWTRSNFSLKNLSAYVHTHKPLLLLSQYCELTSSLPYVSVCSTAVSVQMKPTEKTVTQALGCVTECEKMAFANDCNCNSDKLLLSSSEFSLSLFLSPSLCLWPSFLPDHNNGDCAVPGSVHVQRVRPI